MDILEKEMKNSLQSVRKHKFNQIVWKDFGNSDITYNISFSFAKKNLQRS